VNARAVIAVAFALALGACGDFDHNTDSPSTNAGASATQSAAATDLVADNNPAEELEFEGAFAPTPEAERYVEATIALWDELMSCSADPRFAEVGLSPRTTPCQRWRIQLEALEDDRAAREAMRTGFHCLAGETHSVALSLIPPINDGDRELVEYFRREFEACRGRLERWRASQH
jgi:hypothetical protein